MKREFMINTTLTKDAKDIYDKLPARKKGQWVSESIIAKHKQETGKLSVEEQIEELRIKVERLERLLSEFK